MRQIQRNLVGWPRYRKRRLILDNTGPLLTCRPFGYSLKHIGNESNTAVRHLEQSTSRTAPAHWIPLSHKRKKEAFTKDNNAAHHFFRSYEAQHDIWLSTTAGKRLTHQQLLDRAGTLHSNSRTESRQLTSSQITCLKHQKLERHSGSHRRHATAAESLVARMLTQAAVSQKATNTLLLETSRNLKGKQKHIQNWTIVQYIWIKQVCLLQYEKERRRRRHYLLI